MANLIYIQKLLEHCNPHRALGLSAKLSLETVLAAPEVVDFKPDQKRSNSDSTWHTGRIKHFVLRLQRKEKIDPINIVDTGASHGFSGIPAIFDGHHRLIAHHALGVDRIKCEFDGLTGTLRYLQGRRKTLPDSVFLG